MNWNFESGLPINYQTKSMGADNELVELLWRNGQVCLQSQTTRKQVPNPAESGQAPRQDQPLLKGTNPNGTLGNFNGLIQDDESVSCIQYPFDDPFEKEFGSNLFSEFGSTAPIEADKSIKHYEDKFVKFGAFDSTNILTGSQQQTRVDTIAIPNIPASQMPPPKFYHSDSSQKENNYGGSGKFTNFSQFSIPLREGLRSSNAHFGGEGAGNSVQRDARQFSAITVGSSHCCSNQVSNDLDLSRISSSGIGVSGCAGVPVKENGGNMVSLSERKERETLEPTLTSSSGGSGSSSWRASKQSTDVNSHKRKGKDKEESECQSEDGELESAAGDKQTRKSKSARRSRAAEIHNLSERRRRDRINEKMRALQELIPHCNKTDKASLLDEAIEYTKSLQLQLQVMWMGGGMAAMMFPGMQHYMYRMGMGICPPSVPPNAMHLQRVPVVDHSMSLAANINQTVPCQPPVPNPFNLQNHMQNLFPEQYARYLNFHNMQNASQPLNMFKFGTQALSQGQTMPLPGSSSGAFSGGTVVNDS